MKIDIRDFRAEEGKRISLKKYPTDVEPFYKDKEDYKISKGKYLEKLKALQNLFYSDNKNSLLIIFQGMDASGKDGAISHVMGGVDPAGCQVFSFKQPSREELDHDFIWRNYKALPERGRIGIFNRSYYEEVVIVRIHPEILKGQRLPEKLMNEKTIWRNRYRSIVDIEKHLFNNGTHVIKFFLHLSKEEQKKRFLARIENPEKNWKFSSDDIKEREYWNDYMKAYEECISETTSKRAPWYIIPADDKKNARLLISHVICDKLKSFNLSYPKVSDERKKELLTIRGRLIKNGDANTEVTL